MVAAQGCQYVADTTDMVSRRNGLDARHFWRWWAGEVSAELGYQDVAGRLGPHVGHAAAVRKGQAEAALEQPRQLAGRALRFDAGILRVVGQPARQQLLAGEAVEDSPKDRGWLAMIT